MPTYYVDADAEVNGTGTKESPFNSIFNTLSGDTPANGTLSGDTVYIKGAEVLTERIRISLSFTIYLYGPCVIDGGIVGTPVGNAALEISSTATSIKGGDYWLVIDMHNRSDYWPLYIARFTQIDKMIIQNSRVGAIIGASGAPSEVATIKRLKLLNCRNVNSGPLITQTSNSNTALLIESLYVFNCPCPVVKIYAPGVPGDPAGQDVVIYHATIAPSSSPLTTFEILASVNFIFGSSYFAGSTSFVPTKWTNLQESAVANFDNSYVGPNFHLGETLSAAGENATVSTNNLPGTFDDGVIKFYGRATTTGAIGVFVEGTQLFSRFKETSDQIIAPITISLDFTDSDYCSGAVRISGTTPQKDFGTYNVGSDQYEKERLFFEEVIQYIREGDGIAVRGNLGIPLIASTLPLVTITYSAISAPGTFYARVQENGDLAVEHHNEASDTRDQAVVSPTGYSKTIIDDNGSLDERIIKEQYFEDWVEYFSDNMPNTASFTSVVWPAAFYSVNSIQGKLPARWFWEYLAAAGPDGVDKTVLNSLPLPVPAGTVIRDSFVHQRDQIYNAFKERGFEYRPTVIASPTGDFLVSAALEESNAADYSKISELLEGHGFKTQRLFREKRVAADCPANCLYAYQYNQFELMGGYLDQYPTRENYENYLARLFASFSMNWGFLAVGYVDFSVMTADKLKKFSDEVTRLNAAGLVQNCDQIADQIASGEKPATPSPGKLHGEKFVKYNWIPRPTSDSLLAKAGSLVHKSGYQAIGLDGVPFHQNLPSSGCCECPTRTDSAIFTP